MADAPHSAYNSYAREAQIGEGSSGKIYRVVKDSETFAMKEINICQNPQEKRRRFETEIAILQNLNGHRNILSIVESITDLSDKLCIVTEYCEHGDLKKVINSGDQGLDDERFITIVMTQLCRGIRFIHSNNVLHNNTTIENVFVKSEGVIKIGDFGLSKEIDDEMLQRDISPFESDIYAVGTVLSFLTQRNLDETIAVAPYLKTLTDRLRCFYQRERAVAATVHQLFCKIERKLNSSAEDLEAGPAGGGDGIVSIIINNRDNLIIENEVDYNDNDIDDGSDDYLLRLVIRYLPVEYL